MSLSRGGGNYPRIITQGYDDGVAGSCSHVDVTRVELNTIAYAIGPNYNRPWAAFDDEDKRALTASAAAANASQATTDIEQALVGALSKRYPTSSEEEDFGPWNDAYANALRDVYKANKGHLDPGARAANVPAKGD